LGNDLGVVVAETGFLLHSRTGASVFFPLSCCSWMTVWSAHNPELAAMASPPLKPNHSASRGTACLS
jgi:hypothetical protein